MVSEETLNEIKYCQEHPWNEEIDWTLEHIKTEAEKHLFNCDIFVGKRSNLYYMHTYYIEIRYKGHYCQQFLNDEDLWKYFSEYIKETCERLALYLGRETFFRG